MENEVVVFSWIVTGLLLLANILTGQKKAGGWLVGIVADLSFAVWGVVTKQYGFVFGSVIFAAVRLQNYRRWTASPKRVVPGEPELRVYDGGYAYVCHRGGHVPTSGPIGPCDYEPA